MQRPGTVEEHQETQGDGTLGVRRGGAGMGPHRGPLRPLLGLGVLLE